MYTNADLNTNLKIIAEKCRNAPQDLLNLKTIVEALPESNDTVRPTDACSNCGKKSIKKCSQCNVSRYCSRECQRSHWPVHRQACKIDAEQPKRKYKLESKNFNSTSSCLHGGPESGGKFESLVQCIVAFIARCSEMKLTSQFKNKEEKSLRDIKAHIDFCFDHTKMVIKPQAPMILFSLAVDAFLDSNVDQCREFLRTGMFFECFTAYGVDFIDCVEGRGPTDSPAQIRFRKNLSDTRSRSGLIEFLRSRITCTCLNDKV